MHCRNLVSDLVSIHSAEENQAVLGASASQSVWIGLFKDPWKWSDGSPSSFRHWKPSQPSYLREEDCVATVFRDQGKWNDLQCAVRQHFVCRGGELLFTQLLICQISDLDVSVCCSLPQQGSTFLPPSVQWAPRRPSE